MGDSGKMSVTGCVTFRAVCESSNWSHCYLEPITSVIANCCWWSNLVEFHSNDRVNLSASFAAFLAVSRISQVVMLLRMFVFWDSVQFVELNRI